ncbi:serine hydrolase domain-containing protein [Kaistella jeonii]|uniref:Peptidase n=1 Tax=Kaistella jeonii TaxID=266749 RepID=A0A0C1CZK1_9FLAO|nr:serine hydrolase domain-containing protein [Kaistella jeonii]KIA89856.1 peptidase [Kaistella jeonii]SFB84827.1 CubicO group peptidase, beta-lactamase class C family [Kaistella jeonii]VEI96094.1 D-alanyl-D-alanine carboxypeptidase precursor [Kaistella jeonii]
MKKLIILGVLTLCTGNIFSQTFNKEKLDDYFQALEKNDKFMGSVAISENGKIIYTKSIGYSDVETKAKPNETTKYRIGSISKSFTSALILKAMEENKLSLDTKIDKYFPSIKNANKISISNLLNHRSGIHNFTNSEDYLKWNTQKKSEKELLEIIEKGGSDFAPDSKADYSNSNYVLLSFILEKVYKKPYSEILTEKIIKPVGLKNTYYGGKINLKNNEANSYHFENEWIKEPETDMSIPIGAGAIVSTPSDLLQFADALFGGKIISEKSLILMETLKDNYGYGIFQMPFGTKKAFGHTGGIDGFTSNYGYFPAEKVSFAFTSNGSNYTNNNIAIAVLSAVFNQPYEIPTFKNIDLKTEDLDQYLGNYSSKDIPLKVTVTKSDKTLMAQATGQSAFPLEATDKNIFKFDQAGIVLEFKPSEKKMILNQGAKIYNFDKE